MPVRATKRGAERTPLAGDFDVIVCGASFAGLAVARELTGTGARVLVLDRYEIGEKQTSACGIPTRWLEATGLMDAWQQEFAELVIHTPHTTARVPLPWTFSTFDYRRACALLWEGCEARFETAKVDGRTGLTVHTDRGDLAAPLVVDALGWRRVLSTRETIQPPDAYLSRGLEVHPDGSGRDMELWIDRGYIPAGYAWSFPADRELRVGVGSFRPRDHVKEPTLRLARDEGVPAVRFQGNWIPHRLRDATEDEVFFAGDSAGHCLPVTAEGIRPALYFGIALGRELRNVIEGRCDRATALRRYRAFHDAHRWKYESLLRVQDAVPRVPPRLLARLLSGVLARRGFAHWSFGHYGRICPPELALEASRVPGALAARGETRAPVAA